MVPSTRLAAALAIRRRGRHALDHHDVASGDPAGGAILATYDDLVLVDQFEHPHDIRHGRAAGRAELTAEQAAHHDPLPDRQAVVTRITSGCQCAP
jgi:hypothetical protein